MSSWVKSTYIWILHYQCPAENLAVYNLSSTGIANYKGYVIRPIEKFHDSDKEKTVLLQNFINTKMEEKFARMG